MLVLIKGPTDHAKHLAKDPNDEDGSEDPVSKEMQREEKQISLAEEQIKLIFLQQSEVKLCIRLLEGRLMLVFHCHRRECKF